MTRWIAGLLAALVLLAVAGCGGDDDAGPSATAPPPTTSTAAMEPGPTVASAAAEYEALVIRTNPDVASAVDRARQAGNDGAAVADAMRDHATALQAFADGLSAIEMPANLHDARDQLMRSTLRVLRASQQTASALDEGRMIEAAALADDVRRALSDRYADITVMRSRLGLPPPGEETP